MARCQAFQQTRLWTPEEQAQSIHLFRGDFDAVATRYRAGAFAMVNKRPFLSHRGYVGMETLTTHPVDVIAIFLGARLPYILRPQGRDRYYFLGEAYCDGVMDGEIVSNGLRKHSF